MGRCIYTIPYHNGIYCILGYNDQHDQIAPIPTGFIHSTIKYGSKTEYSTKPFPFLFLIHSEKSFILPFFLLTRIHSRDPHEFLTLTKINLDTHSERRSTEEKDVGMLSRIGSQKTMFGIWEVT